MTRYSNVSHRIAGLVKPAGVVLLALAATALLHTAAHAASGATDEVVHSSTLAQASESSPDANLPFLFAVYIITWAGFFVYVFYMSHRQREMRREIDALAQTVRELEDERKATLQH